MTHARGRPRHPDVLTPAEWQVANLVRHGLSRREIAARRGVSIEAVKYHLTNITGKLGVPGMAGVRRWPGIPAGSRAAMDRTEPAMAEPTALTSVGQIALLVTDLGATEAFYRDVLGLRHLYTYGELTFFECGPTRLFLRVVPVGDWTAGSIVYFRVADLPATYARLVEAGVVFTGAPHVIHVHEDGTEEWMVFLPDPAGNTLALMSRVAPTE